MRKHIPNAITLVNLFLGSCALVTVLSGNFLYTFYLLFFAGLADWLDGGAARFLKVSSPIGKELDSLADMVSFGVVPGAILYMLLQIGQEGESILHFSWAAAPAFLLTAFSGLRLAKFNIDERQTENFIGMATPSMAVFVVGLMLTYHFDYYGMRELVTNKWFLYTVIALFSWLMNAEIEMFSFKFKSLKWTGNEIRIIFIVLSLILLGFFQGAAFSLAVVLYIVLNILMYFTKGSQTS
jgi:CDP-diacylglycerol--serine O-phosphatidyltransferase